ncbi:phosphotransferase family protein [Dongia deserti]|uniref:phosphotransferase family protein n=1 Tax=Dongia deserti TaxID=2268030 RepID=UPI000E65EA4C|nr:aminoglycoside phosphotransferase family protein [Dongia deserti]
MSGWNGDTDAGSPGFQGDAVAFIPDCASAMERLVREARLLRLLASRVSFGLPRILYAGPALQVRAIVSGIQIGGDGRERVFASSPQSMRLADDLGRALAQLHRAFTKQEAKAIGLVHFRPLPDGETLRARLAGKLTDPLVEMAFNSLLVLYCESAPPSMDIVVTHGDVWGGNMAIDPETGALNGLFDFDDAALTDRHIDFMYFHSFSDEFARRALATYAIESDQDASWQRVALYHAVAAFAALADIREKREGYLLQRRLDWISDVCRGPIGRLALGCSGN